MVIWLMLFAVVVSQIITYDIQRAEVIFNDHANMHYQQTN